VPEETALNDVSCLTRPTV